MIILSRRRIETEADRQWAEALANRFPVLSIPFLYDLRSFGPTVRRLQELSEPGVFIAPLPVRTSKNLLRSILNPHRTEDVFFALYDSTDEDSADRIIAAIGNLQKPANVPGGGVERIEEPTVRRWYPVIDAKRCSGCLECVNFCLFGVYVIGENDLPIVDQPDACRDGCPACSRVCPAGAIMFPMHEDPAIAGYVDVPEVSTEAASARADEERQRHLSAEPDDLDELVDRIDRFKPS